MRNSLRIFISIWNQVWFHYRKTKTLLPHDAVLVKMLKPGTTLFYNSFGHRFQSGLDNIVIYEELFDLLPDINSYQYENVIVLNNVKLRYLSSQELVDNYIRIAQTLNPGGQLIVSFNSIWLLWNRLGCDLHTEIDTLTELMKKQGFKCRYKVIKPYQTTTRNGDCFLIFNKL